MKVNHINSKVVQDRIDALQKKGWVFSITETADSGECVAKRSIDDTREFITDRQVVQKHADDIMNAMTQAALMVCVEAEDFDATY